MLDVSWGLAFVVWFLEIYVFYWIGQRNKESWDRECKRIREREHRRNGGIRIGRTVVRF
jgi:hypothetical protein